MCGVRSSKALSTSFDWRLLNVFVFVAYNKRNSKISSSSEELESCSQGASIIHVQWSLNIVCMRIRVISWADSFASAHLEEMFTRAQNYSTCWIFGADGTRDEMHWKRHRTLAFSPYGIVHERSFAKQIALVCAGLYGVSHEWSFAKQIYSSSVPTVLVASNQASSLGPILAPFFFRSSLRSGDWVLCGENWVQHSQWYLSMLHPFATTRAFREIRFRTRDWFSWMSMKCKLLR